MNDKSIKLGLIFASLCLTILFPKIAFVFADYFGIILNYKQFSVEWDLIHHSIQMLLSLGVMMLPVWKKSFADWGFNNWEKKKNKTLIIKFTLGFLFFFPLGKISYLWLSGWPSPLDFNTNEFCVWSKIVFRAIMPGISEEIVFRALVIGILHIAWKESLSIGKLKIPYAGIISAFIFVIAHVGFTLIPFQILYYNIGQLFFAFIFFTLFIILLINKEKNLCLHRYLKKD